MKEITKITSIFQDVCYEKIYQLLPYMDYIITETEDIVTEILMQELSEIKVWVLEKISAIFS